MTFASDILGSNSGAGLGMTTVASSGGMKASILLFDSRPGTRNFVAPVTGKYRVFVVGAGASDSVNSFRGGGGGYSEKVVSLTAGSSYPYTVGAGTSGTGTAGTSSFNAVISATGGSGATLSNVGGSGSGGDINTVGGTGTSGGGASGHRFGNGGNAHLTASGGGGGWSQVGSLNAGGSAGVDGFGMGLIPGISSPNGCGYGAGGYYTTTVTMPAGIGGGAAAGGSSSAGVGGGGGEIPQNGVVGVEIIG